MDNKLIYRKNSKRYLIGFFEDSTNAKRRFSLVNDAQNIPRAICNLWLDYLYTYYEDHEIDYLDGYEEWEEKYEEEAKTDEDYKLMRYRIVHSCMQSDILYPLIENKEYEKAMYYIIDFTKRIDVQGRFVIFDDDIKILNGDEDINQEAFNNLKKCIGAI